MTRQVLATATAVFVGAATAAVAQSASAVLEEVEAGAVEAAGPEEADWRARQVCLEGSTAYVLAVQLLPEADVGAGAIVPAGCESREDCAVATLGVTRAGRPQSDAWEWMAFSVAERGCFDAGAVGARIRVYRLAVRVDW